MLLPTFFYAKSHPLFVRDTPNLADVGEAANYAEHDGMVGVSEMLR